MTEPIVIELEVACDAERAFRIWTQQIDRWWPKDHSRTRDPDITVTFEPAVGGRIFERTAGGDEHDWGTVVEVDPPRLLRYRWHIAWEAERATEVTVRFEPIDDDATAVRVEQRGWEVFGESADTMRAHNRLGWSDVLANFEAAALTSPGG